MKILLVDGSPAIKSHTSALLSHLQVLFAEHDAELESISLKDWQLPYNDPTFHDHPQDHPHDDVRAFVQKVDWAELVVLGTPVYHGAYSGLLKAALDHLTDDAFKGKRVLLVSNAAGIRVSTQGAQQLVIVPRTMGGTVHTRLIGTAKADYEEEDNHFVLVAPDMLERCRAVVAEVVN